MRNVGRLWKKTQNERWADSAELKEYLAKWQQTRKETLDRLEELINQLDKDAKEIDKAQLMGSTRVAGGLAGMMLGQDISVWGFLSLGATARSYRRQDGADAAARFEKFLPARASLRPPISLKFTTEKHGGMVRLAPKRQTRTFSRFCTIIPERFAARRR